MFARIGRDYSLLALRNLPTRSKMNGRYFCDIVLKEARRAVMAITERIIIEETLIHIDNCQVLYSAKAMKRLEEFWLTQIPHPPCSPRNFWFLGWNGDVM
jgi:hypothetical protein